MQYQTVHIKIVEHNIVQHLHSATVNSATRKRCVIKQYIII